MAGSSIKFDMNSPFSQILQRRALHMCKQDSPWLWTKGTNISDVNNIISEWMSHLIMMKTMVRRWDRGHPGRVKRNDTWKGNSEQMPWSNQRELKECAAAGLISSEDWSADCPPTYSGGFWHFPVMTVDVGRVSIPRAGEEWLWCPLWTWNLWWQPTQHAPLSNVCCVRALR